MRNLKSMFAASAVLMLAGGHAVADELRYATFVPPHHPAQRGMQAMADKIAEDTKGGLTFKVFPSAQLLSSKATLGGLRDGVTDTALLVPAVTPNELKYTNVLADTIVFGDSPAAVTGAVLETMLFNCPQCKAEWAAQKSIMLATYTSLPYDLLCHAEIKTFGDLKGKKVRFPGGAFNRWAEPMGAVAVTTTANEIAEALDRGQVDCALAPLYWLSGYSLGDVVKKVLDVDYGSYRPVALLAMNTDVLKKMSPENKKTLMKHIPQAIAQVQMVELAADDKAAEDLAKEKKILVVKGGAEFAKARAEHMKKEYDAIIESAKRRGIEDAKPMIDAFMTSLKKWDAAVAKIGNNQQEYANLLYKEIYSKVQF